MFLLSLENAALFWRSGGLTKVGVLSGILVFAEAVCGFAVVTKRQAALRFDPARPVQPRVWRSIRAAMRHNFCD